MLFFFFCLLTFSFANGGSKCPNRDAIYPCICIDKPIGKTKFETTVVCQRLSYGASLMAIEPGLAAMDIDHFLLYDSYWSDHPRLLQANARIPINVLSTFKMTEVKVVDTVLSTFACPETDNCRTNYLKRFTAINSSVTESPTCNNHFSINSWISCPETIEVVVINGGYKSEQTVLKPDFFPDRLIKLKELRMPNNKIAKIERRTFNDNKFPELNTLDLSHNLLREINILFSSSLKLKHLDLSYNSIRSVVDFQYLPQLQFLNISNNQILTLLQNQWVNIPPNLRTVDLSVRLQGPQKNSITLLSINPGATVEKTANHEKNILIGNTIDCNCSNKWVNTTFHINTNLLGNCASPSEVANMKLRRASRLLNERCDEKGVIQASRIRPTAASTQ